MEWVVLGLVVTAALGWMKARRNRTTELWRSFAEERGLACEGAGMFTPPRLHGRVVGFDVEIAAAIESHGDVQSAYTELKLQTGLDTDLAVERKGMFSGVTGLFRPHEAATGATDFDQGFACSSVDDVDAVGRLGVRARRTLRALCDSSDGWKLLDSGVVVWRGPLHMEDMGRLGHGLDLAVELAEALTDHAGSDSAQLLRRALLDPDPDAGYRKRCFELLVEEQPDSDDRRRALALAESGADPVLRGLAARALGRPLDEGGLALVEEGDEGDLAIASGDGGDLSAPEG